MVAASAFIGPRCSNHVRKGQEHPCLVKDYSDGGVRLQPHGFEIPDDFALLFAPNEPARSGRYKVVWRLGTDVGAKFIGPTSSTRRTRCPAVT